ncbi:MAG: MBL fold metallo-hydrolase, partial [Candidatus Aminicenantes bacterium]|nr:MBL fold metallo-hydrolase [Candidatus Aminicenantes bacterium]
MTKFKWILLLLILPFVLNLIGNAEDIPLRVKKISDRITMFTPGLFGTQVPTTVIETKAGLVAVDTWITPSYAEMTRRRIKQELGRDDVRWVINTHSHFDHTGGNQVYADAEIIGHRNAPDEMKSFMEGKESFIQYRRGRIGQLQSRLKNLDPQSNEALSVKETIDQEETYIRDLQARYVSTPPTRTFEDRLDFTAGDLEIRLLYFGKAHTDSDIFIYIPSEGVLLVGDLFHSEHLGITAGPPLDVPRWIEVLDTVLEDRQAVKTVIGGHGEILSRDWLADQFRYIRGVWEAVSKIREEGGTVDDVSAKFPLQPNFDFMAAHFDLTEESNKKRHADMIRDFWRADSRSATEEIERLLREEGIESARALFEKIRRDDTSGFYIAEAEFNQLGYTFLREQKMQEALAVLTMNSAAFPKSWNVWDSLAEVSMYTGDDQHSEEYYRKSVKLNPDNTNGIRQLSRFEGYRIDKERETQEKPRFKPGEQTGLQGPYLGQSPPGLEPKVFAPGIVS